MRSARIRNNFITVLSIALTLCSLTLELRAQRGLTPDSAYKAEVKIFLVINELDRPLIDAMPELKAFLKNQYADFPESVWNKALEQANPVNQFYVNAAQVYIRYLTLEEMRELIEMTRHNELSGESDLAKKYNGLKLKLLEEGFIAGKQSNKNFMQTCNQLYKEWQQHQPK